MLGRLLLLFIAVPLIDLAILIRVGRVLTFWPTISLVVLTGVAGAALARRQGLRTLGRINAELSAGRMPTSELADGLLILLAGAVLMTPGFLTDGFGLLLLLPAIRRRLKKHLAAYFKSRVVVTDLGAGFGAAVGGMVGDSAGDVAAPAGSRPMKHVENVALGKGAPPTGDDAAANGESP